MVSFITLPGRVLCPQAQLWSFTSLAVKTRLQLCLTASLLVSISVIHILENWFHHLVQDYSSVHMSCGILNFKYDGFIHNAHKFKQAGL